MTLEKRLKWSDFFLFAASGTTLAGLVLMLLAGLGTALACLAGGLGLLAMSEALDHNARA